MTMAVLDHANTDGRAFGFHIDLMMCNAILRVSECTNGVDSLAEFAC
jgi:hypothetical protein